jgi:hypothetical protein
MDRLNLRFKPESVNDVAGLKCHRCSRPVNHNHDLKNVFKSAAMHVSTSPDALGDFYRSLLAKGMKPAMARLTLARKMAAIVLTVWKKGARFDPGELKRQAA